MNEKILALVEEIENEEYRINCDIEAYTNIIGNCKKELKALDKKKKQLLSMLEEQ